MHRRSFLKLVGAATVLPCSQLPEFLSFVSELPVVTKDDIPANVRFVTNLFDYNTLLGVSIIAPERRHAMRARLPYKYSLAQLQVIEFSMMRALLEWYNETNARGSRRQSC